MGAEADREQSKARGSMATRVSMLVNETRAAAAQLPELRQEPGFLTRWLGGARRSHFIAGGVILFGILLLPWLRDFLVEVVLPSKKSSGFFGLGARTRAHPMADDARQWIGLIYWGGGALATAISLLLELPGRRAAGADAGTDRAAKAGSQRAATAATLASGVPGVPASPASHAMATLAAGAVDDAPAPADGEPRYSVEQELGAGGMGVVHRAHDRVLGRRVALKRLYPEVAQNRELATRFLREARVLARLSHPHIVQVFDAGEDDAGMWMAMEYLPDGSLADRVQEGGLPLAEVMPLAVQLADAMAYAHAQGVVHRDFKPDNVLMHGAHNVKVTDFGLARLMLDGGDTKLTRPGAVMGSPAYMSPEQATGAPADARADIYALGVTLYELLVGVPPFDGETPSAVLMQHITETPVVPPAIADTLPEGLMVLLAKMLEKQPEDRPQEMAEVAAALRAV